MRCEKPASSNSIDQIHVIGGAPDMEDHCSPQCLFHRCSAFPAVCRERPNGRVIKWNAGITVHQHGAPFAILEHDHFDLEINLSVRRLDGKSAFLAFYPLRCMTSLPHNHLLPHDRIAKNADCLHIIEDITIIRKVRLLSAWICDYSLAGTFRSFGGREG